MQAINAAVGWGAAAGAAAVAAASDPINAVVGPHTYVGTLQMNPINNLSYILCNWQLFHSELNRYIYGDLTKGSMLRATVAGHPFPIAPLVVIALFPAQYCPYIVGTDSNPIEGIPANEYGLWMKNNPNNANTYDDPQYRK